MLLAAAGACAHLLAPSGTDGRLVGSFLTVTEAEWGMELELNADGTAALEIASWMPGDSGDPTVDRYEGSWTSAGDEITVSLNGEVVVLEYHPQMWFAEFGREGMGPGLRGLTSTFESSLIAGRVFWSQSALEALPKLQLD